MGKHSGGHRGATVQGPTLGRICLLAAGVVVTFAAWCALVYYAIGFAPDARAGETLGWVFLGVATLGAIACLFLALMLAAHLRELLRGAPRAEPVVSRHSKRST